MTDLDKSNPLHVEIMAERASAYFTTVRKMQAALEALSKFDQATKGHLEDKEKRASIFAEAAELAWCFLIQREAMKLPFYEEIFEDFGIPEEVRRKMGPKLPKQ